MTNQFTHIADVTVGRVKGNSKIYPQLRLPSQYAELAGKKASIYKLNANNGGVEFIIRFATENSVAAWHGATEPARRCEPARRSHAEPCRGSQLYHQQ